MNTDITVATQYIDKLMSIPVIADVMAISITLGLASGGFYVIMGIIRPPIQQAKAFIIKNLHRTITVHSSDIMRWKYVVWIERHKKYIHFQRDYKTAWNRELNDYSIVPGYGDAILRHPKFGIMKISRQREEGNQTEQEVDSIYFKIFGFSTKRLNAFFDDVMAIVDDEDNRIDVRTSTEHGWCRTRGPKRVLPPIGRGAKEMLDDLRQFVTNEEFYRQRGIPYKRGYLLYGPAGTGKTSVIAHISREFKMPIYSVSGSHLGMLVDNMSYLNPKSIILIEDIDLTILGMGRANILGDNEDSNPEVASGQAAAANIDTFMGGEALRSMLNILDGIIEVTGSIIIITSNKPDTLDAALLRPGRIDRKIEIGKFNSDEQIEHLNRFYDTNVVLDAPFSEDLAIAEIQNICIMNPHSVDDAIVAIQEKASNA